MGFWGALLSHSGMVTGQWLEVVDTSVANQRNEIDGIGQRKFDARQVVPISEILPPSITPTDTSLITAPGQPTTTRRILTVSTSPRSFVTSHTSHTPLPTSDSNSDGPISNSAAAGISIGSTVGGILILVVVGVLVYRHKKKEQQSEGDGDTSKNLANGGIEMRGADSGPSQV